MTHKDSVRMSEKEIKSIPIQSMLTLLEKEQDTISIENGSIKPRGTELKEKHDPSPETIVH